MKNISAMMRWLRFCGIYVGDDEWRIMLYAKRGFNALMMLETIIPLSIYLHTQDNDLFEIAATFYSLFMFTGMFIQFLIYVRHSGELKLLIEDMTVWMQKQSQLNRHDIFDTVERQVNRYFRVFETFTFFSYTVYIAVPGLSQYLKYRNGLATTETYAASFHDLYYFFETTETPLYHIFYAAYAMGVFVIMALYFAKGFLFISMCFYFVALYDDLKHMLANIDRQPSAGARIRLTGRCVAVHNQIYRFTERANNIMNIVIFIQLVYSFCTLTMLVFSLTFLEPAKMSAPLVNTGCLGGELFLFCWTGSLLLDEANKVNMCVYDLNWFNYTVAEQKSLLMILVRKHRPLGLSAFNYFTCNLQTFYWIMTKVFSAFTFLQSIET